MPPSSALKRSLHSSGLSSDLVTPSYKRRAVDPPPTVPASIERIQAEQQRRSLLNELSTLQRELLEAQTTTREAQAALRERDARVARLEHDREQLAEREVEAKKTRREAEEQLRTSRDEAEGERDEARRDASTAREKADRAHAEARRAVHEAEQARSRAASAVLQADTLQAELEKSDEALETARLSLDEVERERDALTAENEELQRRVRDSGRDGEVDQLRVIREELHRQVTHLKTLEGANARLTRELAHYKAKSADAGVLREQVHTLEAKLKLTDQLRRRLAASEADVDALRSQQEEWLAYLRTDEDATTEHWDSPRQVGRALAATRLEVVGLQERLGQRSADLKARDALVEALEARLDTAEQDVRTQQDAVAEIEAKRAREARMTDLVRREADMLREQLRTYAVEETALGSATGGRAEAIAGLDELLDAHKKELTEAVKEADRLRGMLEASGGNTTRLEDSAPMTNRWRSEGKLGESLVEALRTVDSLRDELADAQRESDMAAKEVASLESTIDRLSKAVGRGEYDSTTTRVLELIDNPAAQDLAIRTSTLDALKAENAALLKRLEHAPAVSASATSPSKVEGMVPKETLETMRNEKAAVEAELDSVVKKSERLKEHFNTRASDFRTAVYRLLGYKIDFKEGGRIRLTSQFAPSKEDYLIFESGSMRLLGGTGEAEWAKREPVKSAIEFWITDRQCLPGFLSTLTLEGYEQSTRGGKHLGFTQG